MEPYQHPGVLHGSTQNTGVMEGGNVKKKYRVLAVQAIKSAIESA